MEPCGGADSVEQPAAWRPQSCLSSALPGLPEHQILWPTMCGATPALVLCQCLQPGHGSSYHLRDQRPHSCAFNLSGPPRYILEMQQSNQLLGIGFNVCVCMNIGFAQAIVNVPSHQLPLCPSIMYTRGGQPVRH